MSLGKPLRGRDIDYCQFLYGYGLMVKVGKGSYMRQEECADRAEEAGPRRLESDLLRGRGLASSIKLAS